MLATVTTTNTLTPKSCSAKGNPGCNRGFVRDRCRKCTLGSIACDMCFSPPSPTSPSPSQSILNQNQGRSRKLHRLSYTSPSSPSAAGASVTFLPRRSLSFDPAGAPPSRSATSSPTPASPGRFPSPFQLRWAPTSPVSSPPSSPTSISFPAKLPATTTPSPSPSPLQTLSAPSPCIYCRNGRKACEDCFGLGYVQRICQDCIRESHRRHNSGVHHHRNEAGGTSGAGLGDGGAPRKASLPSSWNQVGGGWSRFKEQLMLSTGPKGLMTQHNASASAISSVAQPFPTSPTHSSSPVVQALEQIAESEPSDEIDSAMEIKTESAKAPLDRKRSDGYSSSGHVSDGSSKSSSSNARLSFKATVKKHLRVPPLFAQISSQSSTNGHIRSSIKNKGNNKTNKNFNTEGPKNNQNNNNHTRTSSTNNISDNNKKHYRRQWSLSLLSPNLLRTASSAA